MVCRSRWLDSEFGFNRYMVECEYASFAFSNASFARFNRYMVECEYVPPLGFHPPERRFNRYMVECELLQ